MESKRWRLIAIALIAAGVAILAAALLAAMRAVAGVP